MKKVFILISFIMCIVLVSSSCSSNEKNFNSKDAEYIIRFDIYNAFANYVFQLTEDNQIFAYYKDSNSNYEEVFVELNELNISYMRPYIKEVLALNEDEIEGFGYTTDFWRVTLYYDNKKVEFDYGASKSTEVNILIEQIIGCCNFEKNDQEKQTLLPIGSYCRNLFEEYNNQSD